MAGNVYILAQHYGVAPQRVSASILISTAVSILTVSAVIAWVSARARRCDKEGDTMKTISENRAFGGVQGVYTHASEACGCDMTFGLFLPEEAEREPVPVLWYLSGLTCTHENAMVKAGAQKWAAEAGMALVFPDTSPRGPRGCRTMPPIDLGQGAGFYVNATEAPWAPHFRMWDYVTEELPRLLFNAFPVAEERQAITGHSMGGHGALTIAMSFPGRFRSVSAFAPIAQSDGERLGPQAVRGLSGAGRGEMGGA